jgi:virginiamycin B lyase
VDPKTKQAKAFDVPSGKNGINATPYGMAIDANQYVWFAERRTDKVGKVDPKTGEIMEIDIPTKNAVLRRMQADSNGNLWFGQFGGLGKLAMIDYKTGKITEYATPTKHSGAYSVDVDLTRNFVWVNEMMADQIARFDPRTKTFVEYSIPTRNSSIRRIEVDPSRPSRVWFTGLHRDTVGFLDVVE